MTKEILKNHPVCGNRKLSRVQKGTDVRMLPGKAAGIEPKDNEYGMRQ